MVDKNTATADESNLSSDADNGLVSSSVRTFGSKLMQDSKNSEILMEERKGSNYKMPNKKEFITRLISSLAFIPLILILALGSFEVVAALCAIAFAFIGYEIFSPKIKGHMPLRFSMLLFCAVGIVCFLYFRKFYGASRCVFLVCVASCTDIGAYCIGKILKGPKLCPKISPMKTWSGFFGGFFFTNFLYYLHAFSASYKKIPALELIGFFVLQALILAAVFGDLIESAFKRKIGLKDMSNLFPGHGGLLDRLDSLIGVSIVAFLFDYIFGIILAS